ncbi:hypothetical protein M436DRAFT_84809 [Aureobasidium namibiae CBS 147.97]|uniref:Uncharacterized protein n=1 Tax=Aureobasidium namibiae CBS 147.97 TaxID=1043004 RepID=A0A074WAT6_9PEZI
MPSNTKSPQLLLAYTLGILFILVPKATAYLHVPATPSLLSHLLISILFISTSVYLFIDACYTFSWLGYLFLRWLLRVSITFDLDEKTHQWQLPGSDYTRFWFKVFASMVMSCIILYRLSFAKLKAEGDGNVWIQAKRKLEQQRTAAPGAKEKKAEGDLTDVGSAWLWAYCAFAYTNALFDSKEWLESVFTASVQKERTWTWDLCCLWGPMLISGVVGLARWKWPGTTRKGKAQLRGKAVDGKEAPEKQQV